MEKIIEKLMEQAEDCLKEYSKKPEWTPQDLECAYKAACMYDKLQTIKMNNGVWDQIKDDVISEGRSSRSISVPGYGNISYGDTSYARGRDAMTGRYVSRRGGDMAYGNEESMGYGGNMSNGRGNSYGGNTSRRYDNGRSMHSINDQMIQRLEELMDQAGSEYEREKIVEMIKHIRESN